MVISRRIKLRGKHNFKAGMSHVGSSKKRNLKGRDNMRDIGLDVVMILKLDLRKYSVECGLN